MNIRAFGEYVVPTVVCLVALPLLGLGSLEIQPSVGV
jgi:hypothetical protein